MMTRYLKYLRLAAVLYGAVVLSGSIASAQLPDGEGKDTTAQLCGNCHDANIIRSHRQGRDEWIATIQKMMAAGAQGTEEQLLAVLEYVTKNFGPAAGDIKVNQAAAAELESGLGLSGKEAAALVKYRTDKGSFKTLDDLKKVPELDFKKIEAQKDHIVF
jgi:competence protein ComEA